MDDGAIPAAGTIVAAVRKELSAKRTCACWQTLEAREAIIAVADRAACDTHRERVDSSAITTRSGKLGDKLEARALRGNDALELERELFAAPAPVPLSLQLVYSVANEETMALSLLESCGTGSAPRAVAPSSRRRRLIFSLFSRLKVAVKYSSVGEVYRARIARRWRVEG